MGYPAGHRVLVVQDKLEEVDDVYASAKKFGIKLIEDKREQAGVDTGIVVQLGFNAFKAFDTGEPWCSVGSRVAFARYSGKLIKDGDQEFMILNDEDILYVY